MAQQLRGELTERVQDAAKEAFGYEIDKRAIFLIPYILFELPNGTYGQARIERDKINDDDRYWLKRWTQEKRIVWSPPHIRVTKEFYDAACALQWLAFIDTFEEAKK